MQIKAEKFYHLPETVGEFKLFLKAKGMPVEKMTNAQIETAVQCLLNNKPLPKNVRTALYRLLDLGDSCGCDSDHRIRNRETKSKKISYARR
jgi:hypothetical protein